MQAGHSCSLLPGTGWDSCPAVACSSRPPARALHSHGCLHVRQSSHCTSLQLHTCITTHGMRHSRMEGVCRQHQKHSTDMTKQH